MAEDRTPPAVGTRLPMRGWMDTPVEFRKGSFSHAAPGKTVQQLGLPNARDWQPSDAGWKLPPDWKRIILDGMADRLRRHRSFRLFMDTCVRCGACADKCHFYIGSGDPKNMVPRKRGLFVFSVTNRSFSSSPWSRRCGPPRSVVS